MTLQILRKLGAVCALALVFLGLSSAKAYASHFRYGTITYTIRNPAQPNVVLFVVELAFRRTFYTPLPTLGPPPSAVDISGTLDISTFSGGVAGTRITSSEIILQPTFVNAADDYFIGVYAIQVTLPMPTTTTQYKATYTNCCRLSTLNGNNHDVPYSVWTTFEINPDPAAARNQAPRASSVPVIVASANAPLLVQLPFGDAEKDPVTVRLATATESGLVDVKPLSPASGPGAFAVSATGLVTWTPTVVDEYAVQFVLTDSHGASSVIDVLFNVVAQSGTAPTLTLKGSAVPITVTVPAGSTVVVPLQSTDPDVAIGTTNSPTPITLSSGSQPTGSVVTPSLPTTANSPANATFAWTPTIADIGTHVVAFSATDDRGLQKVNSVTINVVAAPTIYIQGTLRDFTAGTTDFAKSGELDNGVTLVQNQLSAGGKPLLAPVTHTSIASDASFANWWAPAGNLFTLTLTNLGTTDPNVYSMNDSLFGPGHQYFTWEGHTSYTYGPGQTITFKSSDDMWVFLNGHLVADMGGVHTAARSATVNFDALGLVAGQSYPLDILYAHRGVSHGATIGVGTTVTPVCSAPGSAAPVLLSGAHLVNANSTLVSATLRLLQPGVTSGAAAAWMPAQVAVTSGFRAAFDFRITLLSGQLAEGLAFVFQPNSTAALGAGGAGLGYSGIANSLAVEFDTHQDGVGDPAFNQVSVHTRGAAGNSELEAFSLDSSSNLSDAPSGTPLSLTNALLHHAVIEYLAADATGVAHLQVYIDNAPVPLVSAPIDAATQAAVFPGGLAFMGFTSGSVSGAQATVDISNLTTAADQPSAAQSRLVALPLTINPGATGSVVVQLYDSCNAPRRIGGDAASLAATLTTTGYSTPVTVTDLNDGTYRLSYTPTVGGLYNLAVTFGATPINNSPFSVLVTPATPTVTVDDLTVTYNGNPRAASGRAKGVNNETLAALTFTYNGSATPPTDAGIYAVVGTFTGDLHYGDASAAGTLVISPVAPALHVNSGPFTFDGNPHAATGTVTGIHGTDLGSPTFTYDGSSTAPTNAGSYSVVASFAAAGNYTAATGTVTLVIHPATPVVAVSGGPFTYDGAAHAATGAVTGVNNVSLGAASLTYNGSATAPTDAGSYAVIATYAAAGNYAAATGTGTLVINRATPTITVGGGPFTYDGTGHPATGSVKGVSDMDLGSASFTYNGSATAPTDAGSYAVVATFTGSGNYTDATATGTLLIRKALPVVTVGGGPFTYDGNPHTATGSVTGLNSTDLGAPTFTYDGSATGPTNAGSYAVVASFAGAANYQAAEAAGTLVISPATPTVTVSGGPFTFDGTAHAVTGTVTGINGTDLGSPTFTYDGSVMAPTNAGSYAVVASFGAAGNYTAATGTGTLVIHPATPVVAVSGGPFPYDGAAHAATAAVTGLNDVSLGSASLTYNGSATAPTDAGSYAVIATYAGAGNYGAATGTGTLVINPATPTITVGGGPFTYSGTAHAATASVKGINDVDLGSASFTYDGSATAPADAGTYAVSARFTGSGNYADATATGTLLIKKALPVVTVGGGPFTYDGSPHTATGSVTGVSNTDLGAPTFTYNGSATAPTSAGSYTVVGSFAGSANYQPAEATASLLIGKAAPSITWAPPSSIVYGTALSGAQLNATSPVAGSFAYAPASGVLAAGPHTLSTAFTPADANNYAGNTASVNLSVTPALLTVTATGASHVYGQPAAAFAASFSGLVNGDTPGALTGALTFSGSAVTASRVGNYTITPGGLSSSNYTIGFADGTLSITSAPLTITASDRTKVLGQTLTFTGTEFTTTPLVAGDSVSSVSLASAGAAGTATLAGSPYAISVSNAVGAGLGNYSITYRPGKLTVVPNTTITSGTPSVATLWPPNKKMVPITIAITLQNPTAFNPVCKVTSVTSNEPVSAGGDWTIVPNSLSLSLRADRLGTGTGRIYTITVTCADTFGNSSTKTTAVTVPHDQGK